jgi:hypothetical protein
VWTGRYVRRSRRCSTWLIGSTTLRILSALVVCFSIAACAGSSATHAGLDQANAEAAARSAFPEATGQLISTRAGPISDFDPAQRVVAGSKWVWAIAIAGSFSLGCGPAPLPGQTQGPCPSPAKRVTVLVGFQDGKFVEAMMAGAQ